MKKIILMLTLVLSLAGCFTPVSDLNIGGRRKLTITEVAKAFKDANLPVRQLEFFNANSDPAQLLGKPDQYTEKAVWQTTEEITHTILAFDNDADLQTAKTQLEAAQPPLDPDYIYVHKNILLHINHQIYLRTAAKYRKTLESL